MEDLLVFKNKINDFKNTANYVRIFRIIKPNFKMGELVETAPIVRLR